MPRRRAERRGLRLWHVWIVLPLAFVTAIAIAASVFFAGWDLLGARELKPEHRIDSKTLFDLVKLSFGVVAGAGALVALVVAYRRQRVDEDGALRDATRLHTERFTTAVSQLGEDSAAVRLGGVHALAGLADDAPNRELRQTCIDVLCAYLRLPYTAEADLPADDAGARHTYLALREVRHTVIRLIRDHLRLSHPHPHSWQGHDFDFTGVTFDGGDFSGITVSDGTLSFVAARFPNGQVDFTRATFSGGRVDFGGATFVGGQVDFGEATFSGGQVDFGGRVGIGRATFSGGQVDFGGATFSGGQVTFGGRTGIGGAKFSGAQVTFEWATFSGGQVDFGGAEFSDGQVDFEYATFSDGQVTFSNARFTGGTVTFSGATFVGGQVTFSTSRFTGGTVTFNGASGTVPDGLPSSGSPLPPGLSLPPTW
ncbi:hypothetical protein CA983_33405 [Streptomyces swartbergensis]|uniref:Pentapeptide repeat-containing protein n=2 Tax=Streptomyces swartbergensis TaxID=487165 RepID=A0A243RKR0_9ACTN|nr:pentapeptide repeat-containing protein [Streptomyces swartbergensis]OUC95457.1 hypothetical protein CA983_33405 [Streptomyces swartbergensis]